MGTVMMATNYNVQELPFSSATNLLNTQFAVSAKPSKSFMHAIECDSHFQANPYKYIRDVNAQDSSVVSDPRFYDMGRTTIATEGIPGDPGYVVGVLYVTYLVDLVTPILNPITSTLFDTTCLTSNNDGGDYNNITDAPGIVAAAAYQCAVSSPTAGSVTSVIPNVPVLATSVYFPSTLTDNVTPFATGFIFSKPGEYCIRVRTVNPAFSSIVASTTTQTLPTLTATGDFAISSDTLECNMPQAFGKNDASEMGAVNFAYYFRVTGTSGTATFTSGTYTAYTSSLALETSVTITWVRTKATLAEEVDD